MLRIVGVVLYIFTFLLLVGCLDAPAIPEPSQEPLDKPYTEEKVANTPKVSPEETPDFSYSISSPLDGNMQNLFFSKGIRDYLAVGKSYSYKIEFSLPVEKDSVINDVLKPHLGNMIAWHIRWLSDQSLVLTINLEDKDALDIYDEVRLSMAGVKSQKGLVLNHHEPTIRFQPTKMKQLYTHNLLSGIKRPLQKTLISYASLDYSANGNWILAGELAARQSVLFTVYSLLDKNGNRARDLGVVGSQNKRTRGER
jgi:hypothetical protein